MFLKYNPGLARSFKSSPLVVRLYCSIFFGGFPHRHRTKVAKLLLRVTKESVAAASKAPSLHGHVRGLNMKVMTERVDAKRIFRLKHSVTKKPNYAKDTL